MTLLGQSHLTGAVQAIAAHDAGIDPGNVAVHDAIKGTGSAGNHPAYVVLLTGSMDHTTL